MTRPTDPALRDPAQETEYVRKLLLGLMSTLESKGLLTETEIGVIVRAAGQAVYAAPVPTPQRKEAAGSAPDRSSTDMASTDSSGTDKPSTGKPSTDKTSAVQPASIPLLDFTLD